MSKFSKLYSLASKATGKRFNLRREVEGVTFAQRFDGFPSSLTAKAVEQLAEDIGSRVAVKAPIGSADGSGTGTLGGRDSAAFVRELTAESDPKPAPEKANTNGKPADVLVAA